MYARLGIIVAYNSEPDGQRNDVEVIREGYYKVALLPPLGSITNSDSTEQTKIVNAYPLSLGRGHAHNFSQYVYSTYKVGDKVVLLQLSDQHYIILGSLANLAHLDTFININTTHCSIFGNEQHIIEPSINSYLYSSGQLFASNNTGTGFGSIVVPANTSNTTTISYTVTGNALLSSSLHPVCSFNVKFHFNEKDFLQNLFTKNPSLTFNIPDNLFTVGSLKFSYQYPAEIRDLIKGLDYIYHNNVFSKFDENKTSIFIRHDYNTPVLTKNHTDIYKNSIVTNTFCYYINPSITGSYASTEYRNSTGVIKYGAIAKEFLTANKVFESEQRFVTHDSAVYLYTNTAIPFKPNFTDNHNHTQYRYTLKNSLTEIKTSEVYLLVSAQSSNNDFNAGNITEIHSIKSSESYYKKSVYSYSYKNESGYRQSGVMANFIAKTLNNTGNIVFSLGVAHGNAGKLTQITDTLAIKFSLNRLSETVHSEQLQLTTAASLINLNNDVISITARTAIHLKTQKLVLDANEIVLNGQNIGLKANALINLSAPEVAINAGPDIDTTVPSNSSVGISSTATPSQFAIATKTVQQNDFKDMLKKQAEELKKFLNNWLTDASSVLYNDTKSKVNSIPSFLSPGTVDRLILLICRPETIILLVLAILYNLLRKLLDSLLALLHDTALQLLKNALKKLKELIEKLKQNNPLLAKLLTILEKLIQILILITDLVVMFLSLINTLLGKLFDFALFIATLFAVAKHAIYKYCKTSSETSVISSLIPTLPITDPPNAEIDSTEDNKTTHSEIISEIIDNLPETEITENLGNTITALENTFSYVEQVLDYLANQQETLTNILVNEGLLTVSDINTDANNLIDFINTDFQTAINNCENMIDEYITIYNRFCIT